MTPNTTLELYAARVRGAPCGCSFPPVVGGAPWEKDVRPCAIRLNDYVADLDRDVKRTVVPNETDPDALEIEANNAAKGLGEDHVAVKATREMVADLRRTRKGKNDDQIKADIAFFKAWQTWRKGTFGAWFSGLGPLQYPLADDGEYEQCITYEKALLGPSGWRAKYKALGYAPSTDAPTTAEVAADVDASKPKSEANPLGAVASAVSSIAGAIPWIAAAVVGVVAVNAYRGR